MSDWQPIETAPKDGTLVLIINAYCPEPTPFVASWRQDDQWDDNPDWLVGYDDMWKSESHGKIRHRNSGPAYYLGAVSSPSHWMPLPEPPA